MAIAPEGKGVLLWAALLGVLGVSVSIVFFEQVAVWIALPSLIPLAFALHFFRDPDRRPPDEPDIAVAPADGRVIEVAEAQPEFLREKGSVPSESPSHIKVSIFMSPLNVHVNRIPASGQVAGLYYQKGKFGGAFKSQASSANERQYIRLNTAYGALGCVQVAGWLARRIVCHLKMDQGTVAGQRFGIIKFGSRVDLYLPKPCRLAVRMGQRTKAGETIIAHFREGKSK
jgi:phosphatidylserine decarboxylase